MSDAQIMSIGIPILVVAAALAVIGPILQKRASPAAAFKRRVAALGGRYLGLRATAAFLDSVGYPKPEEIHFSSKTGSTLSFSLKVGPSARGAGFDLPGRVGSYKLDMQGGMELELGGRPTTFVLEIEEGASHRGNADRQFTASYLVLHAWQIQKEGEATRPADAVAERLRPSLRFLERQPGISHVAIRLPAGKAEAALADGGAWSMFRELLG
ncbi:MAG: hypothetical protein JXA15_06535 [Spirochaetales bacterium]|nr:hypothetical protein [Spirochaetales bacterium]